MHRNIHIFIALALVGFACGGSGSEKSTVEPEAWEPSEGVLAAEYASVPSYGVAGQKKGGDRSVSIDVLNHQDLTVLVGAVINWENEDTVSHTVTSGIPGNDDGVFDSGEIASGDSFEFSFSEPGEYSYYCDIHPEMSATITVTLAE